MAHEKIIGEWLDPLGRKILLSFDQWVLHILKRHSDMAVRLEWIGKTVEQPELILQDRNASLYFRPVPGRSAMRYLKVVVNKYTYYVVTAYHTRRIKLRGILEWRKS